MAGVWSHHKFEIPLSDEREEGGERKRRRFNLWIRFLTVTGSSIRYESFDLSDLRSTGSFPRHTEVINQSMLNFFYQLPLLLVRKQIRLWKFLIYWDCDWERTLKLLLWRHVDRHFEDEELARDMELAKQLEFAPPSQVLPMFSQLSFCILSSIR